MLSQDLRTGTVRGNRKRAGVGPRVGSLANRHTAIGCAQRFL